MDRIQIDWGNFTQYVSVIIDILLVSYVIYKLIMLLRGTRAIQLLKGIMVIVVAWLASTFLELRTLQWLMSQAFTYGVLAIIIIFQPELRRALEQLGRGRFFSRTGSVDEQAVSRLVNEVNKAAQYMAKRRIGGLIVIERNTGLSDYIETGTEIEGKVSSELLINIFIPNTPLHDGAVIIRKNMVMAAGCYLPLSENPTIDRDLGTRHRAAIGMSEVSDALSVVISEETGNVSIAVNGELKRGLSEEEVREFLMQELRPSEKSQSGFWNWKVKNDG
ncbi:MAG: TIGR00159 family protein [Bacillaceae bacterium]|nr:TIGR00159 family protein [Bacillaceae bacterium]